VISAKNRSTMLSQEAPVGVKVLRHVAVRPSLCTQEHDLRTGRQPLCRRGSPRQGFELVALLVGEVQRFLRPSRPHMAVASPMVVSNHWTVQPTANSEIRNGVVVQDTSSPWQKSFADECEGFGPRSRGQGARSQANRWIRRDLATRRSARRPARSPNGLLPRAARCLRRSGHGWCAHGRERGPDHSLRRRRLATARMPPARRSMVAGSGAT